MNKFLSFGDDINNFNKLIKSNYPQDCNFKQACSRVCEEIKSLNIFDVIEKNDFSTLDKEFQDKHKKFILNNPRLFGHGIWKFHIINRVFENSQDGDKILYSDSGCRYLPNIKKELLAAINSNFDVIDHTHGGGDMFHRGWMKGASTNNETWTKMDTLERLNVTEEVRKQQMHASGVLLFTVNSKTRKLVKEIDEIMQSDYHLIDDTPSIKNNIEGYMEHRHDQSIYSLCLCSNKDLKVSSTCKKWVSKFRYRKG